MGRQESAEAIVACQDRAAKGRTWSAGRQADGSMVRDYAEGRAGMPGACPEGSGRKPREQGLGASSTAAPAVSARPEAARLLEAILDRENMMAAYHRVVANRGAAGVDAMTVDDLKAFLGEHWPRIKEDLLAGRYRPQPVRRVEIPKPGGGSAHLGDPHGAGPADPAGAASGAVTALRPGFLASSATASGRGAAPTRRCWRRASMWRRAGAGWWTSTWRSSSTG